ncbi:DUF58 domain-containing protein [Pseudactinotalea terrae]|uniref:DUF58 domain-containing protein n=1 Tax=Pseudactinotalea terrae TaxID=1743262 RepID=UPI0012E1C050|nr:DUF58 domain-containing protein [Pseudactinotalea terrae]
MILTSGATATALVAVVVLAIGVAGGRPDVAVLSVPFLLMVLWAGLTRPRRPGDLEVRATSEHSETGKVRAEAVLATSRGVEAVLLRVSTQGYRPKEALVAAGKERTIPLSLETSRTGVHDMFRVDWMAESFGAMLLSAPAKAGPMPVAVHPVARPLKDMPLPFRLPGLTGTHTSRRVGEGYETHDVHEFAPGDRLRRIDWRVSARRAIDTSTGRLGTLYARRTFATADATVMIVVDSRDDVGEDVSAWAGGVDVRMDETTSLDIAREAAAAISRAYLDLGDRVGLDDLGRRRRPVAPAAGRHQWERIQQRLVRVAPEGWPDKRHRPPQLPSGALVVLCSTFLDDEAARIARQWRSYGHRVIAVDTLPRVSTAFLNGFQETALRLLLLARRQRLRALRRTGVELVDWSTSTAVELHALARTRQRGGAR